MASISKTETSPNSVGSVGAALLEEDMTPVVLVKHSIGDHRQYFETMVERLNSRKDLSFEDREKEMRVLSLYHTALVVEEQNPHSQLFSTAPGDFHQTFVRVFQIHTEKIRVEGADPNLATAFKSVATSKLVDKLRQEYLQEKSTPLAVDSSQAGWSCTIL
jgi:hypothetical protein